MKRVLLLCLTALLLAGCGKQEAVPVSEAPTTEATAADPYAGMTQEEIAVVRCREVLEQIQSSESYHITMTRWHEGIWDFTGQVEYYRHGEDRATISRQAGEDTDGVDPEWFGTGISVQKDGVTYSGYQAAGEEMVWDEPNANDIPYEPWLYTFDWEAQEVELTGIFDTSAGRCVSFTVHAPYDIGYGIAETHTVNFLFDEQGAFRMQEMIASAEEYTPTYVTGEDGSWVRLQPDDPRAEKTGRTIARMDQMTVDSLDPETISAAIDSLYQAAVTAEKG